MADPKTYTAEEVREWLRSRAARLRNRIHLHSVRSFEREDMLERAAEVDQLAEDFGKADAPSVCGGSLFYEVAAGIVRVHRDGRYRFLCSKCRHEGENDGNAVPCDRPAKEVSRGQ